MYYITINKCILITVNKCIHIISTYFLAAARDKNMHLLTSLYGIAPTFPKRIDFADWSWKVKVMLHERKNVPLPAEQQILTLFTCMALFKFFHGGNRSQKMLWKVEL